MSIKPPFIVQIAIPIPLRITHFDYLPPPNTPKTDYQPGIRVRVPFGTGQKQRDTIGLILGTTEHTDLDPNRLKTLTERLDTQPILSDTQLKLLHWASNYYHHPLGQVIASALPTLLMKGEATTLAIPDQAVWAVTADGRAIDPDQLPKTTRNRQGTLLKLLQQTPLGHNEATLALALTNPRQTLRALQRRGWIAPLPPQINTATQPPLPLNNAQHTVVETLTAHAQQFYPCLLEGVTGSGKTEVYLQILQQLLQAGRQALVLIPEINLTPQTVARFRERIPLPLVVLHSGLTDAARLHAWLAARDGQAAIIIGTRSAVWTPLARPGIIIIDEEHDPAYKQQDAFRYSARDVAVWRARQAQIPILLGSATPALESFYNAQQGRYHHFTLPERAGSAIHPTFQLIDMRQQPRHNPFSPPLQAAMQAHIAAGQQVLIFFNRRGYAPTLMCYHCGWIALCNHCDAHLIYHDGIKTLRCHHCGATQALPPHCPACQMADLHPVGHGTERLNEQLQALLPEARIIRIDSDTTRPRNAMAELLTQVQQGEVDILLGTQMLAKGHHFPNVTLVGVINTDSGLFSVDFRAPERMAQLVTQVAGRAGRVAAPGLVLVQTYHPEHPLLQRLLTQGYPTFAAAALQEREHAQLPPYAHLALLRADAPTLAQAMQFLQQIKALAATIPTVTNVSLWGPVAAPMTKRSGRYRAQLLLQASQRSPLHQFLNQWLPCLPKNYKIRWSLDIDPQDLT